MKSRFLCAVISCCLLASVASFAQSSGGGPQILVNTAAKLALQTGYRVGTVGIVTDGNSTSDCTAGGGSNFVLCVWSGSSWGTFAIGTATAAGVTGDLQGNSVGALSAFHQLTISGNSLVAGSSLTFNLGAMPAGNLTLPNASVTNVMLANPSISLGCPAQFNCTGGNLGSSMNLSWQSAGNNLVLATPNGFSGIPSLRALVATDLPTALQNGTTATTQAPADSSAQLATTAFAHSVAGAAGNISGLSGTTQGAPIIGGPAGAINTLVTLDASAFPGAGANDACNKIQAAGLAAQGNGVSAVDARAFKGNQPCSVNPFAIAGGWPSIPLYLGCAVTYQLQVGWVMPSGTRLLGCDGATSNLPGATLQAVSGFPTTGVASTVFCWGNVTCGDAFAFSAPVEWINIDANNIALFGITDGLSSMGGPFAVTNITGTSGGNSTLTGTFTGGASNMYVGSSYKISGGGANNGLTFGPCSSSTTTTMVCASSGAVTDATAVTATSVGNTGNAEELSGVHHFRIINWTGVGLAIMNAGSQHTTIEDGQIFIPGNTCGNFLSTGGQGLAGGTALQIGSTNGTGPAAIMVKKITITYQGCTTSLLPSAPPIMVDTATDVTFEQVHIETSGNNTNANIPAIPWLSIGAYGPVIQMDVKPLEGGTSTAPTAGKSVLAQVGANPTTANCTPMCTVPPPVGGPAITGCTSGGTCPFSKNIRLDLTGGTACQSTYGVGGTFGYLLADYVSPGINNNGSNPTFIQCGASLPANNHVVDYLVGSSFSFIHNAPNTGFVGSGDAIISGICPGSMTASATLFPFWGLGSNIATGCTNTTNVPLLGFQALASGIVTGFSYTCASGTAGTDVVTLRKNAADQTLTCTSAGTTPTGCSDGVTANPQTTHTFTFLPGDTITAKVVTTASTSANCQLEIVRK